MTQEEKQLLIKDICARLPYGVIIHTWYEKYLDIKCTGVNVYTNAVDLDIPDDDDARVYVDNVKPYLRPMSSMSKDEIQEYKTLFRWIEVDGWGGETVLDFVVKMEDYIYLGDILNWLNAHHFDYRDLIEKGLALEAPEGMYGENC